MGITHFPELVQLRLSELALVFTLIRIKKVVLYLQEHVYTGCKRTLSAG